MTTSPRDEGVVRFGVFEADLRSGELRKSGIKIKLRDQPFQVLATLLEHPGAIVTREDLRQRLWPDGAFVDFDHGLNTAINKIRQALGDSADNPRFIETLPKRGYRFVGPIAAGPGTTAGPAPRVGNVEATRPATRSNDRRWLFTVRFAAPWVSLLLASGLIVRFWIEAPEPTPPASVVKFAYAPGKNFREPVISPDGRQIAYVAGEDEETLWIQDLARTAPREIKGTEGARGPFWAPGSDFVGFAAGAQLKKVAVDGEGVVVALCDLPMLDFRGGAWSPDGDSIIFKTKFGHPGAYDVPAQGGDPKPLDPEAGPKNQPHFLRAGASGRVLLSAADLVDRQGPVEITLHHSETGEETVLAEGRFPVYSATGHVIYQSVDPADVLWALPFSTETLRPTGDAFPIAQNASHPSVSRDGTLVYHEGPGGGLVQLFWRDRRGNDLGPVGQPQENIRYLQLSPDGSRVAVGGLEGGNRDIWLHDVNRSLKERFTFRPEADAMPVWSPSGKHLLFVSHPPAEMPQPDIFIQPVDRSAKAQALVSTPLFEAATDWSLDGRFILFHRPKPSDSRDFDIWYLKQLGNSEKFEEVPYLQVPGSQGAAKFSPDGRFVVYTGVESGSRGIWVRPFAKGAERWQVSADARQPRWSKDGTEIFYIEGNTLLAVKVTTTPTFSTGSKEELFQSERFLGSYQPQYDVTADGQRFVVAERVGEETPAAIRVVQNWYEEFRDRRGGEQ